MAGGRRGPFRQLAATPRWRQRFLDVKAGLGHLFPGAVTEWTFAQRQISSWLRYYDGFYERCGSQGLVVDKEIVSSAMAVSDIIVDAFIVWYERKYKQKRAEQPDPRAPDEARVPKPTEHKVVYRSAHG